MKMIAPLQPRSAGRHCDRSMLASSALSPAALVLPLAAEPAAALRETLARGLVAEEVNPPRNHSKSSLI